ncbi:GNAT family N-acetyltransferase [Halorarius halobius]|uniref:GNAT family N-acetyltransferase n=1 Tax=Halorarius halobius TaxID=2962671 RepID=UPI0020CBF13E|nr:GNAT family N-acetyltransferase [Halorarius halobius]
MDTECVETFTDEQMRDLVGLLETTRWAADRARQGVERMVARTDAVVGLVDRDADGRLVAFARALTDGTYRAFVYDVVVAPDYRDRGLGARVVEELLAHPAVRDAEAVDLYCQKEMVEFYEQWAFTDDVGGLRLMRRSD